MILPNHDDMFLAYVELCRKLRIRPRVLESDSELEYEYIRLVEWFHDGSDNIRKDNNGRKLFNLSR